MQHAFNFTLEKIICLKKHNNNNNIKVDIFCLYFETKKMRYFCLNFKTKGVLNLQRKIVKEGICMFFLITQSGLIAK